MNDIPYTVRRSARARRVRVNVHAHARRRGGAPDACPRAGGRGRRGSELRPWIERRLARGARDARAGGRARRHGPLPGRAARSWCRRPGRTRVHRRGERLLVPAGDPRPALERFYRRAARAEIGARLDRATALAGTPYSGLSIRAQRTRWASCSAKGRMSFNWRLLMAPESVLDYVVWHEVCHLRGPRPLAPLLGARRAPLAALARGPRLAAPQRRDAGAVAAQPRCSSGT